MKIGFGIITYDKFEEVKILADIIKSLNKDFLVIATSNHPECKKPLDCENIDEIVVSEDIPFAPNSWETNRENINMSMRVTFNIQACNKALLAHKELDYCVFLHSDSWILSTKGLYQILENMKEKKKVFAVTGIGFSYMSLNAPLGNIMDMIWVYERAPVEISGLFTFDVVEMMPHKLDSHGIIAINLITKIGLGKILYYENAQDAYLWKSEYLSEKIEKYKYINIGIPAAYFDRFDFVHIHTGAYTDKLGDQMQAYYLRKYNLTSGKTISDFLSRHTMNEKAVFEGVKKLDKKVKRKLAIHGLTYGLLGHGKNYTKIIRILDKSSLLSKAKLILYCWTKGIFLRFYSREKYFDDFYGSKTKIGLGKYYLDNIYKREEFEKLNHSQWYKDYNGKF